MHVISSEAIAFQPTRAPLSLASSMTAIFQKVIDYRDSLDCSRTEKCQKVMDFFKNKMAVQLLSTIERYTGIHMSMVIPKHLIANWAILMDFEGDRGKTVDSIIRQYSGILSDTNYQEYVRSKGKLCLTAKDMKEFAESLNKDTGFVNAAILKKHKFYCKLYFDVYGSFLIKETGAEACEYLTAPEITAVILHEVGHAMSFIEHSADIIFRKDVLQYSLDVFNKNAPIKERLKFVKETMPSIYPDKAKEIEAVSKYAEEEDDGSLIWSGINILINTYFAVFGALIFGVCNLIGSTLREIVNLLGYSAYQNIKELNKVKTSEFYNMPMNDMYCEVLADEFVSRFGYGGHFVSQMSKLMQWCRITGLGDMYMKQFNTASFYGRLMPWAIYTTVFGDRFSKDYPDEKHRYELMLLDTLAAFKNMDLPDGMLDDYYKAYNIIKTSIENPSAEQRYVRVWDSVHDALNYIFSTPTALLFTGRFDTEYNRLYETVKNLTNNELFALAYKLRTQK